MRLSELELVDYLVTKHGSVNQLRKVTEECLELAIEIQRLYTGGWVLDALVLELVQVEFMMQQIAFMVGRDLQHSAFEAYVREVAARLNCEVESVFAEYRKQTKAPQYIGETVAVLMVLALECIWCVDRWKTDWQSRFVEKSVMTSHVAKVQFLCLHFRNMMTPALVDAAKAEEIERLNHRIALGEL